MSNLTARFLRRGIFAACLVHSACERSSDPPPPRAHAPVPATHDAGVSREACDRILRKADVFIGHSAPRDPVKHEREITECVNQATPEAMRCAEQARTYEELSACQR